MHDPHRVDQVRFALVRRHEVISKHGKAHASKLADKELRYIFFQLSNPLMLLALAVAHDLGELTLRLELDFLQRRGAMRLALLPEFILLTALRRTAIEQAERELRAELTDEEVAHADEQLQRFRSDEATTAELLPISMPPSVAVLRPAIVSSTPIADERKATRMTARVRKPSEKVTAAAQSGLSADEIDFSILQIERQAAKRGQWLSWCLIRLFNC